MSIFTVQLSAGWGTYFLPALLVGMVASAAAVLVTPVLGVHRRIVAKKDAELARLSAAIQPAQTRMLEAGDTAPPELVAPLWASSLFDSPAYETLPRRRRPGRATSARTAPGAPP